MHRSRSSAFSILRWSLRWRLKQTSNKSRDGPLVTSWAVAPTLAITPHAYATEHASILLRRNKQVSFPGILCSDIPCYTRISTLFSSLCMPVPMHNWFCRSQASISWLFIRRTASVSPISVIPKHRAGPQCDAIRRPSHGPRTREEWICKSTGQANFDPVKERQTLLVMHFVLKIKLTIPRELVFATPDVRTDTYARLEMNSPHSVSRGRMRLTICPR